MGKFFIGIGWIALILAWPNLSTAQNQSIETAETETEFLTPKAVQAGIDGAIDYLRRTQRNGSWEEYPNNDPGTTALCLLALLSADLPPEDKTVAAGLDYLSKFTPETQNQTYPIALQTMVLAQANPKKYRAQIEANVKWLIARQFKTTNHYRGGWSYTGLDQSYSRADNSNSQFAVLALYEAEKGGVPVPHEVWTEIEDYWVRLQNPDGSWGYRADPQWEADAKENRNRNKSGNGTGSMTCAGIVSLLISGENRAKGASVEGERIVCCQETDGENDARIDRGLDWLTEHFSVRTNPGTPINSDTYIFYYLYGLERAGRLTAHRYIGRNDWYREGADYLLRRKGALSQFWKAGLALERVNQVATSFALLFLSKGRWPVLISKLKFDANVIDENGNSSSEIGPWNLHPNDLDHLTRYAESQWDRKMTWQVIDSRIAVVDDYVQTPVLSISGRTSPLPIDDGERKRFIDGIRGYLEQGGFLLAEALDGDESFESGFLELMKEVFPEEENGGLHLLPADHPIWNMEREIPADKLRPLYGIDFGCRTSVVFIPEVIAGKKRTAESITAPPDVDSVPPSVDEDAPSLSCLWELAGNLHRDNGYSPRIQSEVTAGLDIGLNILAYATGRELKFKEEIPPSLEKEEGNSSRNDFYAAILDLGGGSACAPRAIPNLMKRIESDLGIPVRTEVKRIRPDSPDLFVSPLLFLHGRNSFALSEKRVSHLRDYFERGGFLFANAICASQRFQTAFATEMKRVFPDSELVPIPADDPLFSNRYGGYSIKELEIRKPTRRDGRRTESLVTKAPPELVGIRREDRWVVVFSPYDVSCALEKNGAIECSGYSPESAFQLSVNIVLYAMEHL